MKHVPPPPSAPLPPEPVRFNGTATEYFGIWIVNVLLSVVTFGIYSAWAKVRTRKYFLQNTVIAGRRFDYHATGLQILIGRIIVLMGIMIWSTLSAIPIASLILFLVALVLVPWLISRSLKFNARMTSWANVRFGFDGGGLGAAVAYFLWPFLALLTVYLAWPFAARARDGYVIGNHRLGSAGFRFSSPIGPYYRAFLAVLFWLVLTAVVMMLLGGGAIREMIEGRAPLPADMALLGVGFALFFFLGLIPAATIWTAFLRNAVFAGIRLQGGHRLHSDVDPMRLVWIMVSNAFVVFLSLGLMLPWARIRLARYQAAHTAVLPGGSLDEFANGLAQQQSALGDAFTDLQAVDLGLPV